MPTISLGHGPPSSATKKQQSIASFFTPKTTSSTPSTGRRPTSTSTSKNKATSADHHASDDDLSDQDRRDGRRASASTPKRALEQNENLDPDDDADEDISPPAAKRLRRQQSRSDQDQTTSNAPVGTKKGRALSARTSKYLFNGSSSQTTKGQMDADDDGGNNVDEHTQREREKLHQRFVKKLGPPDSIADIKRRNRFITEDTVEGDDDDGEAQLGEADEDEEDEGGPSRSKSAPSKGGRKGVATKKAGSKLTPMEKQVVEIKRKHMDTLMIIEVGYKFRFFGEDARIAAKELSIVCIPGKFRYDEREWHLPYKCLPCHDLAADDFSDPSEAHIDRFASASVPVHRLHVHVKRLVAAGHKVGVVRQLETAALKAVGDNRNAPFVRRLTNLYTKGTYIDDVEGLEGPTSGPSGGAPATGYLLCLTETNAKGWGTDEKVHVGIVAVQPATGDVIYDDFEDGFMRSEIETRLLHSSYSRSGNFHPYRADPSL